MMKRTHGTAKRILALVLTMLMVITSVPALSLVAFAEGISALLEDELSRYELNFNKDWKFYLGDVTGAQNNAYSDSAWATVDLPHDYSIIQDFTTNGTDGESGSLPGGYGWYRKSFIMPSDYNGRSVIINFAASYCETQVYVNGTLVGENLYGYNPFSFDITDYLNFNGSTKNVIAVRVNNPIPTSRWYSGSGLIGDVTMTIVNPVHVSLYGTQVTTPNLASSDGSDGRTDVAVTLQNDSNVSKTVTVNTTIYGPSGNVVKTGTYTNATISANSSVTYTITHFDINNPSLWSVDTPNLYKVKTEILSGSTVVDEYWTTYGYTWSEWDEATGCYLNGQPLKIQGVCMHLDQGALGAAQEYDAFYRQISILKEMGVNAIRTSHNIFPSSYYEICNELGILVMEEFFDGWVTNKNSNYNAFGNHFNDSISSTNKAIGASGKKWYQFALTQSVKRDRNNPCIFVWDVGNELDDVNSTDIASDMKNIIDYLDTRPILWGNNKESAQAIDSYMDLFGGNYHIGDYITIGEGSGFGKPFVGTETASAIGSRGEYSWTSSNWSRSGTSYEHNMNYASSSNYQVSAYDSAKVGWGNTAADAWYNTIAYDWNAGEFVWTGFDYIGEPTPWNAYQNSNPNYPYPNSSYFGIIDTAGFAKDSYYLYNSWWDTSETTLHITPGTWNQSHLALSNNYVDVAVYTNANYIELLCNGNVIATATATTHTTGAGYTYKTYTENISDSSKCRVGTLDGSDDHDMYPLFEVYYNSSDVITAKAYTAQGGTEITSTVGTKRVAANSVSQIQLNAWNNDTTLTADGDSFNYIEITALDANGNFANDYNGTVNITLNGAGKIAGVDNGNAATVQKYQHSTALLTDKSAQIQLFNGKALVIVQSTEETGTITVSVDPTESLATKTISMTSVAEAGDELTDEFEEVVNQTANPGTGTDAESELLEERYNLFRNQINALITPVSESQYVNYELGSTVPEYVPTGTYIIVGENGSSSGVLNTTSSVTGTLDTSGADPTASSQTFAFTRKSDGKYTIAFTGQHITNEFLNISSSGITVGIAPQDLTVNYSNGTVTIGDGTNFITYSSSASNQAGVSTSGTALKLYTIDDSTSRASRSASGVTRWGDVGIVEDGRYIIWGQSQETNNPGYIMTPNHNGSTTTVAGFGAISASPDGNVIESDAENEVIITKVENSDKYTLQLSTGKYVNISTQSHSIVLESDTPVETSILQYGTEEKVVIGTGNLGQASTGYVLDIFSNPVVFSQYTQTAGKAGINERFTLYKKTESATGSEIALYNALTQAITAQPNVYTDDTYDVLLDSVQAGYEAYTSDTVSDAEKVEYATAVTAAYNALEPDGVVISPTLKDDINNLPAPDTSGDRYEKYTATSGTPIPDGIYIIYSTDAGGSSYKVMSGTAKSYTASDGGENGTVWGYARTTGTVSGNRITTDAANEWTIRYDSASGKYSLKNASGKYMNISQNTKLLVKNSDTETFVEIEARSDGTVFIKNGNQYLQNMDTSSRPMFSTWKIQSPPPTGSQNYITLFRKIVSTSSQKQALYNALKDNNIDRSYYTTASFNELQKALQEGYNVYTDANSTDEQAIAAKTAIEEAYAALEMDLSQAAIQNMINNLTEPSTLTFTKFTVSDASAIPDGKYIITSTYANGSDTTDVHMMSNQTSGGTVGTLAITEKNMTNGVVTLSSGEMGYVYEFSHVSGISERIYYNVKNAETGKYLKIPEGAGNEKLLTFDTYEWSIHVEKDANGNIAMSKRNGNQGSAGEGAHIYLDYYRNDGYFSTYGKESPSDNNKLTLYRNERDYLEEALKTGAAMDEALFTEGSYSNLLSKLLEGVSVYESGSSASADIQNAITAINQAIDDLEYLNRKPVIDSQINALTRPTDEVIENHIYERYVANTAAGQIPVFEGDYVITYEPDMTTTATVDAMYGGMNGEGRTDKGWINKVSGDVDKITNTTSNAANYIYTFIRLEGTTDQYYIQVKNGDNAKRYLNLGSSNNALSFTTEPQQLTIKAMTGVDDSNRNVAGKVQIYSTNYTATGTQKPYLFLENETNSGKFTSWANNGPDQHRGAGNMFSLYRNVNEADLDILYDALQLAKGVEASLYTDETIDVFYDAVQDGIDLYSSGTEEQQRNAAAKIYALYDKLAPKDLRNYLQNQLNNLKPDDNTEAYYARYTAKNVANNIIPDGEYVIAGSYDTSTQSYGATGVMTYTYVTAPGNVWSTDPTNVWTAMGYAASGAAPDIRSPKWTITRDENTGYYRISRLNGSRIEYLYIKEGINNDDYYLSYTVEGTELYNTRALWEAEIQSDGRVIFNIATGSHAGIAFTGEAAHLDENGYSSTVTPFVTSLHDGGTPLELYRVENNRLTKWNVAVADGAYVITNHGTDAAQTSNTQTSLMQNLTGTVDSSVGFIRQNNIVIANNTFVLNGATITRNELKTMVVNEFNFTRVESTNDRYYITTNNGLYLKINGLDSAILTNTPTECVVTADANGNVVISDTSGSYLLASHANKNVFTAYNNSSSNEHNKMRLFYASRLDDSSAKTRLLEVLHETIEIEQGDYTDESYDALLEAISDGIDTYKTGTTNDEFTAAANAIEAAIDALEIPEKISTFGATLYKYGFSSHDDYSSGGHDMNEIAYKRMEELMRASPDIMSQIEAVADNQHTDIAFDNVSQKQALVDALVTEYAKLYSMAITSNAIHGGTTVSNYYQTFWNLWNKSGTTDASAGETRDQGASVQGLFSTTLNEHGLPTYREPYTSTIKYTNVADDNVNHGQENNVIVSGNKGGYQRNFTLTPLSNISVYVPDYFSENDILSASYIDNGEETYAKYYWDFSMPFVEEMNEFGVSTYTFDASDPDYVLQVEFDDENHKATGHLTEITAGSDTGGVDGPPSDKQRGFFPFNYTLNGSNSSMSTREDAVYHFGLSYTTDFYIPSTGTYDDGQDIVFDFWGDDDVLVYIDNVLVLDNAGLHGAREAKINFTQKSVTYQYLAEIEDNAVTNPDSPNITYTYGAANAGISAQNQAALDYLNKIANDGEQHTMSFFYLERGSSESNAKISFNVQKISDNVRLQDQTYVLDYGLPIEANVKDNNSVITSDNKTPVYEYIGITEELPFEAEKGMMFRYPDAQEVLPFDTRGQVTYQGRYGTVVANQDGNIRYTLTSMHLESSGEIYFCARVTNDPTYEEGTVYYTFEKVTLIPATSIYFEDDFGKNTTNGITYTHGSVPIGESNPDNYGAWEILTDGNKALTLQSSKASTYTASDVYGHDEGYEQFAYYSNASIHKVKVSAKNNPNASYSGGEGASWPEAEFNFAGTGIDIISLTSKNTGAVNVVVRDADGDVVKNHTVNTYYGYQYGRLYRTPAGEQTLEPDGNTPLYFNAKRYYTTTPTYYNDSGEIVTENPDGSFEEAFAIGWIMGSGVAEDVDNAMYQIPIIKIDDLDFGTYTVKITPMYSSKMDTAKNGNYDFYLDAIRVYNPAGYGDTLTDQTISYAYTNDKEGHTDYLELRNMLIGTDHLTEGTYAEGAVFVDGISDNTDVSTYTAGGPNNELYLSENQAIAFEIWATALPHDLQIGARYACHTDTKQSAPRMEITYGSGSTNVITASQNILSATDLNYSVDVMLTQNGATGINWSYATDEQGNPVMSPDGKQYYTSGVIIIRNTGSEGILSITSIKWTFPSAGIGYYKNNAAVSAASEPEELTLMSDTRTLAKTRMAVRMNYADLDVKQDSVEINNTAPTVGDDVTVKVTTSTDVSTLVIRDNNGNVITPEKLESYVETIDNEDVQVWEVTLKQNEAGEYVYYITGAYANGYEGGTPAVITVNVVAPEENVETPEEPEEELSFFEQLIGFFNKLIDFFKKIVAMFTNEL